MGNDKIKVICFLTFIGKGPFCLYSVNFFKTPFHLCISCTLSNYHHSLSYMLPVFSCSSKEVVLFFSMSRETIVFS